MWVAALFFGVMSVLFWALERSFPARRERVFRSEWGTDFLFYAGQAVVWNGAVVSGLVLVAQVTTTLPLGGLRDSVRSLPLWAQIALIIVLCDVAIYWFHRASHALPFLWRFHRVHHTTEHLDWLAAYREHPIDGFFTRLVENLPAILLGFPLEVIAGFVAFRGLWGLFIHSNVSLRLGPLEWLVGAPRLHHWHHEKSENNHCNFANLSPIMDRLFGTFYDPEAAPLRFGIVEPSPRSYLGQLVAPLVPAWSVRAFGGSGSADEVVTRLEHASAHAAARCFGRTGVHGASPSIRHRWLDRPGGAD